MSRILTKANLIRYRKGMVPIVNFIGQAVSLGLLHGTALAVAELILDAATVAGVIAVGNGRKSLPSSTDLT